MVAPSSACSSLATPPVLVFAALQRRPPRRSSACEENTQLTHSSFSSNIAQPYSYTSKPRPTSQHTPRAPSPSVHTFPIASTHANTQSHHVAVMKSIITFNVPYKSLSPPRQCTPPFHRRQVVAPSSACSSLATPPVLVFAALQRIRPPRSLQCLRRITHNCTLHSSFSSNIDIQPHTHLLITSSHLSTHTPTAPSPSAPTFPTATALTHMQTHNHITSLS